MNANKITKEHLTVCLAVLSAVLLAGPERVGALQEGKNPDYEMVAQNRNSGWIESVAVSPDDRYILSGSGDATIKLWNKEGMLLRTFDGGSGWVYSVAFSPDGKYIAAGFANGKIKFWSIDGNFIRTFEGHSEAVQSISFSPDGKHILSGSYDATIKLWNTDGNLIRSFNGHSDRVQSVSFNPDGKLFVSGSWDNTIKLWSIDGDLIRTIPGLSLFKGHSAIVNSVAFSPDGKYIASGSKDRTIKLWDLEGNLVRALGGHSDEVKSVSFSPDGKYIISASADKTLRLWDINGKHISTFAGNATTVESALFSHDGTFIASGSGAIVRLWNIEGELIRTFEGHSDSVTSLAFSRDGKYLASGSHGDGIINLWTMKGTLVGTFGTHSGMVASMSFSPDNKYLACGNLDSTITLWDLEGDLIRIFKAHSVAASVSFSPDGKQLVSGSGDKIELWSVDGNLIKTFAGHSTMAHSVSFSPDGKRIISGGYDNTLKLWDLEGNLIRTFKGHSGWVESVSFSPDGNYIVSGSWDNTIKLWKIDGELIKTFDGHSSMLRSVSFTPDGKHIVSSSDDRTIKLWDLEGNLIKTLDTSWGSGASLSYDGKYIASGALDSVIKLWDIDSEQYVFLLSDRNDWVVYTPDGYFDASPHGGELIAMVKGLTAYGVDQFAVRNNRPDLILERMGLGTPELINHYDMLYQKRLRKLGLTEADLSSELHVPEAKITGTKQDGKFVDISFTFSDDQYPLKRCDIYVNDVPLFGSGGKEISGKSFAGTEKIELTAGRNKIELSAINDTGAESYRALTYADYYGKEKGALYYLAFGASKYKDDQLSLNYADKDVKDLEAVLSKMRPAFSDLHVKTFLNSEVTAENIKKAKKLLKDAKTDDTVILAFAGLGGYSMGRDPKYYYVAYETDVNDLPGTGVDFEAIEDLLDDIKPRKKLFLLDTGESCERDDNIHENYYLPPFASGLKPRTFRKPMTAHGKADEKGRDYLHEKDRFIYNDLARRTGAVVFSSSKGGEISYESTTIQNGFFTKEIINALTSKAADKNGDGKIDSGELRDFVSGAVSKGTGGLQHPTIDRDNLYQKIELPLILN